MCVVANLAQLAVKVILNEVVVVYLPAVRVDELSHFLLVIY